MYATHFGLRRRPFRSTPDQESYYPATTHEHALTLLLEGLKEEEGLLLLTGAPGIGKTLLCQRLLNQLDPAVNGVFLTNSHFSGRSGLLQAILYDLSLPYQGLGEQELRLTLTDHLLQNYAAGKRAVIVIDEAQHLTADLLEELRLLSNLETTHGKVVQIVFVAQPGILETLRRPELAGFGQRLMVRVVLEPLGVAEAVDYIAHHLRLAGGRPELLVSDEALELLARGTGGVPRLLSQATHQALDLAASAGATAVDAEAVLEALNRLGLEVDLEADEPAPSSGATQDAVAGLFPPEAEHEIETAIPDPTLESPPFFPLNAAEEPSSHRLVPPKKPA